MKTAAVKRTRIKCGLFWNNPCDYFSSSKHPDDRCIHCDDDGLCNYSKAWVGASEDIRPGLYAQQNSFSARAK